MRWASQSARITTHRPMDSIFDTSFRTQRAMTLHAVKCESVSASLTAPVVRVADGSGHEPCHEILNNDGAVLQLRFVSIEARTERRPEKSHIRRVPFPVAIVPPQHKSIDISAANAQRHDSFRWSMSRTSHRIWDSCNGIVAETGPLCRVSNAGIGLRGGDGRSCN